MSKQVVAASAVGAGLAWLTWDGLRLTWHDTTRGECSSGAEYSGDALFAVASLLVAFTMLALATRLAGVARWLAVAGVAAAVGATMMGLGNAVEHCVAEPFFLGYVAGALLLFVATAAVGIGVVVTGAMGRLPGVLLVVAAFAPWLSYERGSATVQGVAWVAFGLVLALRGRGQGRGGVP